MNRSEDTGAPDLNRIRELIARSSLGTRGAQALQNRTPDSEIDHILDLRQHMQHHQSRDLEPQACEPRGVPVGSDIGMCPELDEYLIDGQHRVTAILGSGGFGKAAFARMLAQEWVTAPEPVYVDMTEFAQPLPTPARTLVQIKSWSTDPACVKHSQPGHELGEKLCLAARFDVAFDRYSEMRCTPPSTALWDLLTVMVTNAPRTARRVRLQGMDIAWTVATFGASDWPAAPGAVDCGVDAVVVTVTGSGAEGFLVSAYEAIANYAGAQRHTRDTAPAAKHVLDQLRDVAESFADELAKADAHQPQPKEPGVLIIVDNAEEDVPLVRFDGHAATLVRPSEQHTTEPGSVLLIDDTDGFRHSA
ncbi:hypothetical protein [Nocardia sp. NPDC051832]|uniref:hypothetical protein n=1 Tax=Nocardia sp. NPDC051832 TaxID=3155673 RepID=UPI003415CA81